MCQIRWADKREVNEKLLQNERYGSCDIFEGRPIGNLRNDQILRWRIVGL